MERLNRDGIKYLLAPFCWSVMMTLSFFIAAGRLDVPRAWLAYGLHFLGAVAGALLMGRFAPGLLNQRGAVRQGTKSWDKRILLLYFLLVLLVIPAVAGLDAGRYNGSHPGSAFAVAGVVLYCAFFLLFHWAMLVNAHFEGTVRIQHDRDHRVVSSGPYRLVRHPGYLAMILGCLADPFIIGSFYALIPASSAIIVLVIRTRLEDRMLQTELTGYGDYARRVRFRIVPGLW